MTMSGLAYKCSAGETFDSVSLVVYGHEKYTCDLLCANPALCHLTSFEGGEELLLPVVEIVETEEMSDEEIMPDTPPWKE